MIKRSHNIYAAAMLALSAAAFAPAIASAQVGVSVVIGNAPPPARFESIPAPRHGYVWAPGYWNWDGHRHVWLAGRWENERRGAEYRRAEWIREGGGWRLDPGGWVTVSSVPTRVDYVTVAPPPPRYEAVPGPRVGYIWAPGYWDWRGNRHEWIGGSWISARPGYVYAQPHWVQRDGRWLREEARWERGPYGDRDHDGIPNRYDRDRDGDGVPNRYDRRPDNPRRD
ncbi:thrombospondin type 3 repeat-containing protein [Rugamonas rivuli]|uniref:thrombospondin type 3 repeat-containing protein n=1 Tax=Rugamonas rivuli TaxID=2743358 RepID=UPI0038B48F2C